MTARFASLKARRALTLYGLLLTPTVFLAFFFLGPLSIMMVYTFLTPGLYGGVEWVFSHLNYGRILGWADTRYDQFDPVYISICLRSVRLAADAWRDRLRAVG